MSQDLIRVAVFSILFRRDGKYSVDATDLFAEVVRFVPKLKIVSLGGFTKTVLGKGYLVIYYSLVRSACSARYYKYIHMCYVTVCLFNRLEHAWATFCHWGPKCAFGT